MAADEQLGDLAQQIRKLTDGTPERELYLERLAADIREGRYKVNADELADKLIEEVFRDHLRPEEQK